MPDLWNSLSAVLLIMVMTAVGYIFGKAGWMKATHKDLVIKFLINAAVPCLIVSNTFEHMKSDDLQGVGMLLLVALASMAATLTLSLAVAKLLKIPRERFGGFVVMGAFSNALFVGLPMCEILFNKTGNSYVILFHTVNAMLFWTIGNYLIHRSGKGSSYSIKSSIKSLLSPPLVCLFISIVLLLFNVKMPDILLTLTNKMGASVTPLALLYTGFVMYETGIKNIRIDKGMSVVLIMRLIIAPLITIGLCLLTGITGVQRGVFIIESAMPVMTQSVVVSAYAGADEKYNALGMTLTTLACVVVVPVLMMIV